MNDMSIEVAEPDKLLLLWTILNPPEGEWFLSDWDYKHTEMRPRYLFRTIISEGRIDEILQELYDLEVIDHIYVTLHLYDSNSTKYVYYLGKEKLKDKPEGVIPISVLYELATIPEEYGVFYSMAINHDAADRFLRTYLEKWRSDGLYFPRSNILKAELQIDTLVRSIFAIIKEYSHTNMLIPFKSEANQRLDMLAVLLFLEEIGDITLKEWVTNKASTPEPSLRNISFRVTLTKKFFQDFISGKDAVLFDFNDLVPSQYTEDRQIFFSAPYRLYCGANEYRLKKGKLPYILMNKALKDYPTRSVDMNELLNEAAISIEEAKKGIENFRRALRERFQYSQDETFFDIKDDQIILKSRLFQAASK